MQFRESILILLMLTGAAFLPTLASTRALVMKTLKRFNVQAVIHFAARGYVGESVQHPRKYFDNNVSKTLTLLNTLLDAGVDKVVFSSSCATYGIPRALPGIASISRSNLVESRGGSVLIARTDRTA